MLTTPDISPTTKSAPSDDAARLVIAEACRVVGAGVLGRTSQTRRVLSAPPETPRVPSGDTATLFTAPAWPQYVRSTSPLGSSHALMLPSMLLEITTSPILLRKTALRTAPLCPLNVRSS